MSRPAYLIQPNIQRLPNLLRDVREGEIRIPRFQRPFVWTTDQRLLLLQSIYEGMPIGSFLIWRTKEHDLRCYDRLGSLRLAWSSRDEDEKNGGIRQYLLDGHQRLTTLYVALGESLTPGEQDLPGSDSEQITDENWPIFFDLEERAFKLNKKRTEPPSTWLPLSILLDPYKLFEFQKQLLGGKTDRALVNRTESLASIFKDYTIPVVPIVTEDLEIATQSFQRLNNGGTPMTEVHMVSALTWSPDFDLNERIQEVLTELGEVGWQDLEDKMILNICKAALDLDIYYADAEEIRKSLKGRPQVLEEASKSLKAAARFLRDQCKVYGPAILPYSFQIVLIADAIWRSTGCLERELSPEAAILIRKWFWITTYTEHFAGISAVRLARTLEHLRLFTAEGGSPEPPGASRKVAQMPRRFDFRSARSRAAALRMADLQEGLIIAGHGPYERLSVYGRNAMPMLMLRNNKTLPKSAEGPENRFLISPESASVFRNAILFGTRDQGTDTQIQTLFAIPEPAVQALKSNDYETFLTERRKELLNLEEQFVSGLGLQYDRG